MASGRHTAGGQHRNVAARVDDLRHERERADSACVRAGFSALGHDHVDTTLERTADMAGTADQRGGRLTQLLRPLDRRTRRTDPARKQIDVARHHGFELFFFDLLGSDEAGTHARTARFGNGVLLDDPFDERAVLVGDVRLDCLAAVVLGHAVGQDQVHTEWLVTHQSANLGQLLVDFVGEATGRPVDTEPASVRDCGDRGDVVREAEDRILDAV